MDEQLMNVSNSHKVREGTTAKNKVEPPKMKGTVEVKKKNGLVKFAEAFLPEDVTDVRSYILSEVIVPSIKKIIDEIFHIILWGSGDYSRSSRPSSRMSYQNYFDKKRSSNRSSLSSDPGVYVLDRDFVFDYMSDAEDFVRWMLEMIHEQGFIRLSEANEEFGQTGYYTDPHYGWKNLDGWRVVENKGRYILKLPRPFYID